MPVNSAEFKESIWYTAKVWVWWILINIFLTEAEEHTTQLYSSVKDILTQVQIHKLLFLNFTIHVQQ